VPLSCPNCTREYAGHQTGVCPHCGADLRYLMENPVRVHVVIWLCMWLGLVLVTMAFIHLLYQALDGSIPELSVLDAWAVGMGIFFSVLGTRAWRGLGQFVRARLLAGHYRPQSQRTERRE